MKGSDLQRRGVRGGSLEREEAGRLGSVAGRVGHAIGRCWDRYFGEGRGGEAGSAEGRKGEARTCSREARTCSRKAPTCSGEVLRRYSDTTQFLQIASSKETTNGS